MKKCIKCNKFLPETSFRKRGGENYLRTECKTCDAKLSKVRKELRKKHGSPPPNYRCPICKKGEDERKGQGGKKCSTWVVDHCHETDSFRGWLCHKCNRGLGAFDHDTDIIKRTIEYLNNG